MSLRSLKCRDDFGRWLNEHGLTGCGVEVGSLCGDYARSIMREWQGKSLTLIDPWERQPDDVYREPTNRSDWDAAYKSCSNLAEQYPGRVALLRGYSPEVSNKFKDGSLDFVYIDARHDYEAVSADLSAWWPKVKEGGILCGHDFRVEINDTQYCEVKPAVEKFLKSHKLTMHYTPVAGCGSWWITKP